MTNILRFWSIFMVLLIATPALAQTCPLAGEKPMLVVRIYFGQDVPGKGAVTEAQWRAFLKDEVTPRFPAGFTVYDAAGQWRDTKTGGEVRELSKVVELAVQDSQPVRDRIQDIAARYQRLFHQQSVGIVSNNMCGKF
jgi:hypothetical protein